MRKKALLALSILMILALVACGSKPLITLSDYEEKLPTFFTDVSEPDISGLCNTTSLLLNGEQKEFDENEIWGRTIYYKGNGDEHSTDYEGAFSLSDYELKVKVTFIEGVVDAITFGIEGVQTATVAGFVSELAAQSESEVYSIRKLYSAASSKEEFISDLSLEGSWATYIAQWTIKNNQGIKYKMTMVHTGGDAVAAFSMRKA